MLTEQIAVPHISPVTVPEPDPLKQARRLVRKRGLLQAHDDEKSLIKRLKALERFDYARKLLEIWRDPASLAAHPDKTPERRVWLTQQHALCTYKDPDLPADARLRRAWDILSSIRTPDCEDPETLGLAGAIQKRWWEHNAQREHLELALAYYRRGFEKRMDSGYTAINAAFVLDLLAGQQAAADAPGGADAAAQALREQASGIRRQIVARAVPAGTAG